MYSWQSTEGKEPSCVLLWPKYRPSRLAGYYTSNLLSQLSGATIQKHQEKNIRCVFGQNNFFVHEKYNSFQDSGCSWKKASGV